MVDNALNFDNSSSLAITINNPQTLVTLNLSECKNLRATYAAGLICLWDRRVSDSMININV